VIVGFGRKNIDIIGDSSGIMGFVLSFNPLSLGLEKTLDYGKFDIQFFTVQYHSMAIFPQRNTFIFQFWATLPMFYNAFAIFANIMISGRATFFITLQKKDNFNLNLAIKRLAH
jgi:hypothetical protein